MGKEEPGPSANSTGPKINCERNGLLLRPLWISIHPRGLMRYDPLMVAACIHPHPSSGGKSQKTRRSRKSKTVRSRYVVA